MRKLLFAVSFVALVGAAACGDKATEPTPVDPATAQKQAEEEARKAACAQKSVTAHAQQGFSFVDLWFSEEFVSLVGIPRNAERAPLEPTCGYPAEAGWTTVLDSSALSCSMLGQLTALRGGSLFCVGRGIVVVIIRHNGFTGSSAFMVSDVGVRRSLTRTEVAGDPELAAQLAYLLEADKGIDADRSIRTLSAVERAAVRAALAELR
jgi:hypothetical protein